MTDERFEALVLQLENDVGGGVYLMGHLTPEARKDEEVKKTDAYKMGWNDSQLSISMRLAATVERAKEGISSDQSMLLSSGYCFQDEDGGLSLNMNDTWAWALSWCPKVPKEQIEEVATLFKKYGFAGLLYWNSKQNEDMRSEFHDINRYIDFVANEERITKEVPDYNKRAYHKASYTIGPK